MAIGTPGAEDVDDDRLALELETALVKPLAGLIDAAKMKCFLRIFDFCQALGEDIGIGAGDIFAAFRGEGSDTDEPAELPSG